MKQFRVGPKVCYCDTAEEFAREFQIGEGDLLITNAFLYEPFFGALDLKCEVLFQESYGKGEPTDEMAEAMYADLKTQPKRIIAVGGGTVIDISKLFALKYTVPILDLFDRKLPVERDKGLVLVPTTCGTGSEVTNVSILALVSRSTKQGLADDALYADQAVLIPELLKSLPFFFFATSSIDALVHAVESSLSPKATAHSRLFGYRAIEIILKGFQKIRDEGQDARFDLLADFLTAANYAGISFGNAGTAAVHACAYPLAATYHVAHGESNYAFFTTVLKHYMTVRTDGEIAVMNAFIADLLGCGVTEVYDELEKLLDTLIPKKPLRAYGVTEEDLAVFADSVIENQQRLMVNSFVPLDREDVYRIFRACW